MQFPFRLSFLTPKCVAIFRGSNSYIIKYKSLDICILLFSRTMFNTTLTKNYIKHILNAKTRHGTHSPFVYNLVDKVIYDFSDKPAYHKIEKLRESLLVDPRSITVTDLGAGSQVNNQRVKTIKAIAKNALKPKKLAQLLYRLAKEFNPHTLLELGTCLGVTTAYFSTALPGSRIIS
ncbi:MAG TPA: hypothetical protein VF273_01660, partial [Pelobium sp.]